MTLNGITLPAGLMWADEFDWTPVAQNSTVTLTGALLVQEATALAGRPITLEGRDDGCWASRAGIQQLYAMMQTADRVMTLIMDGVSHRVIWRREGNSQPIEARLLFEVANPDSDDWYVLKTLKFTKVA
jgi:hypothetical protein